MPRNKNNENGGAFLEFALVFPLCLVFLFGIFELGRMLSQYSWVQQTTYNAAFLGSGLTTNSNQTLPQDVAARLYSLQNAAARNPMTSQPDINILSRTDGSMEVGISGPMKMIMPGTPLSLKVSSVSPGLLVPYNAGDLNRFENASEFYDCNGNPCGNAGCSPFGC